MNYEEMQAETDRLAMQSVNAKELLRSIADAIWEWRKTGTPDMRKIAEWSDAADSLLGIDRE